MENFLFHGLREINGELSVLFNILENGYILPRCQIANSEKMDTNNIFNGTKYISLCQKSLMNYPKEDFERYSYDDYIYNKICFVIKNEDKNLIYPSYVERDFVSPEEWKRIIFNDDDQRYSYYLDEVQTKDPISIKDIIAIGLPVATLEYLLGKNVYNDFVEKLRNTLKEKNLNIPICDSSMYSFADDYQRIENSNILKLKK